MVAAAVMLVSVAVVTLAIRQGLSSSPDRGVTSVYGALLFFDAAASQNNCSGTDDYRDVTAGSPVTLTDQNGTVLSATTLGAGQATSTQGVCRFVFVFSQVPTTETQYGLVLPHRSDIVRSNAQMVDANWTFNITLSRR